MLGDTLRIMGLSGERFDMPLPAGDVGTDGTIAAMVALVHESANSPLVDRAVQEITTEASRGHYGTGSDRLAFATFRWLKHKVIFCKDPATTELLRQPDIMLSDIFTRGNTCVDCDEMAILGAAILRRMGFRTVFFTVSQRPDGKFQHVYFGFFRNDAPMSGYLTAMDPQECTAPGAEVRHTRKKVYAIA